MGLVARSGSGGAFQRVRADEWLGKQGSRDNSYKATFGSSGWGARAQERLGQVLLCAVTGLAMPAAQMPHVRTVRVDTCG